MSENDKWNVRTYVWNISKVKLWKFSDLLDFDVKEIFRHLNSIQFLFSFAQFYLQLYRLWNPIYDPGENFASLQWLIGILVY